MKKALMAFGSAALVIGCSGTSAREADAPPAATPETAAVVEATPTPPAPARARRPAPARAVGTAAAPRVVPEYREFMVPAGTVLSLALDTALGSDTSDIEDAVRATLREDIIVDGESVLAAGSVVAGRVTDVERSGRVKGRARLAFRFTTLAHGGDEYDVRTQAIERVAEATKRRDATKIGIGAGAGAAVGALLGGGSGAAKGAAIGAAAGTGAVLATRGEEVRLEAGETVQTTLTTALPVRVRMDGGR